MRPNLSNLNKTLVFDIEIQKPPRPTDPSKIREDMMYCENWDDFENMGIACIGTYSYLTGDYQTFFSHKSKLADPNGYYMFKLLLDEHKYFVTFNGVNFDNRLLRAEWGIDISEYGFNLDILRGVYEALGVSTKREDWMPETHGGYGLDAFAEANLGIRKTGNGIDAAYLYQWNRYSELVNYCTRDVEITKRLFEITVDGAGLVNPKDHNRLIRLDW